MGLELGSGIIGLGLGLEVKMHPFALKNPSESVRRRLFGQSVTIRHFKRRDFYFCRTNALEF